MSASVISHGTLNARDRKRAMSCEFAWPWILTDELLIDLWTLSCHRSTTGDPPCLVSRSEAASIKSYCANTYTLAHTHTHTHTQPTDRSLYTASTYTQSSLIHTGYGAVRRHAVSQGVIQCKAYGNASGVMQCGSVRCVAVAHGAARRDAPHPVWKNFLSDAWQPLSTNRLAVTMAYT